MKYLKKLNVYESVMSRYKFNDQKFGDVDKIIVDALNIVMPKFAPKDLTKWAYEIYGYDNNHDKYVFDITIEGMENVKIGPAIIEKVYINDMVVGYVSEVNKLLKKHKDYIKSVDSSWSWDKSKKGNQISDSQMYVICGQVFELTLTDWLKRGGKVDLWK